MEGILRTDISDLKPLTQWSSGRVGLISDAAHATTQNLGQGGAMAVEDALALADAFQELGLNDAAGKRFEQLRRKKVDWTAATSWSIGKICHLGNPLVRVLRNLALKKTPDRVTQKQIQRIYSLESTSDRSWDVGVGSNTPRHSDGESRLLHVSSAQQPGRAHWRFGTFSRRLLLASG